MLRFSSQGLIYCKLFQICIWPCIREVVVIKGSGGLRVRDQNSSKHGMRNTSMQLYADRALWYVFCGGWSSVLLKHVQVMGLPGAEKTRLQSCSKMGLPARLQLLYYSWQPCLWSGHTLTCAVLRYIHTVLALKKLKVVKLVYAPQCSAADMVRGAAGCELGQSRCDGDRATLWLKVTPHCFLTKPLFIRCLHSNFGPEPKNIEWSSLFSLCGVGCFALIK